MEKWFRDALQAGVRDDLLRTQRSLDDLERLRMQVTQRSVAILSGSGVVDADPGTCPALGQRVRALRQALMQESEQLKRRYRLLYPTEARIAQCDEELRSRVTEVGDRYARLMNADIPQCMAVLDRAARRFEDRRDSHGNRIGTEVKREDARANR